MPADNVADLPDKQIEQLRQDLRQARWNLALAVLLLLAFFGSIGVVVYFVKVRLPTKKQQIIGEVKDRLVNEIQPVISDDASEFLQQTAEPVSRAVADRLRDRLPAYVETISKQGEKLSKHLTNTVEESVKGRYHRMILGYRKILEQEFPKADKELLDRMTARIEKALDRLVRRYYVDAFHKRIDQTVQLWKSIKPLPTGRPGEKPLRQQLTQGVEEWVTLKVLEGVVGKEAAPDLVPPALKPPPAPDRKEGKR
jgi:hypothetical protein